ncbi:MAG: PaaI family thioesterase, partial [Chloroflexi bacterium]|nr:PaaI family thioesterase [Chloroflexota bacterium]
MTGEAGPRDELRAAIDGLTDTQTRTLLAWAQTLGRDERALEAEGSVGALGDALGIVSEVREPGRSRMRLDVDPAWHNPNGVLHGGLIYTLIDYSMGG